MSFAILNDITRCTGCGGCAAACKEANKLPAGDLDKLSAVTWTFVQHHRKLHVRRQCMHCLEPTCASVCPVAALERSKEGAVIYHEEKCIGCRYCIMACPFEIPKYEWSSTTPRVRKCIMCYSRIIEGKQPACTSVCPAGATIFGQREELIRTAKQRQRDFPKQYVEKIYGIEEAGGTSVLYLSDIEFERLGFKNARTDTAYPKLTWSVLSQLPTVVSLGGVCMFGIVWIINRRMKMARLHSEKSEHEGPDSQ